MHHNKIRNLALLTLTAWAALTAPAWAQEAKPTTEQVIVPQVERREVKPPQYPSRDFAVGLFAGSYATENFGAAAVGGLRLSYHITEDIFVDAALGQSKVSDENFRQILPGGLFVNGSEKLSYYSVSAGYNVLPGEVFIGRGTALATQGYLLAGIGSTRFAGQRQQTLHAGFGVRLLMKQRFALQADVRDHVFSLDLLGKRQSTQNIEVTAGLTVFFLTAMRKLLLLAVLAASGAATAAVTVQTPAPDFTLRSTEGRNLRLKEQRGQVVLVNFWASWCGPCKQEMPHFNRLHDKYRSAGFVLLGVNIDEDAKLGAATAGRWGLKFPVLLDTDKTVVRQYDLGSMPATVLIDRDGRVRHLHRGYREGIEATYEQQIRELVKE